MHARLLDLVPGRSGTVYKTWLDQRGKAFKAHVEVATLDPFRGYKNAIDDKLADATAVLPRLRGLTWCHRCSSTPRVVTPANRASSSARVLRMGWMEHHTVFHATPSWRAKPWMEACSRRTCSITHRHARVVNNARGRAC